jgi:hypothetical protein
MHLQLRVLLFVGLIATNSVAADLADILREPKKYYDQKVVVEGVVRISRGLYLFSDIPTAAQVKVTKAALVILKDPGDWELDEFAPERALDRKRVRVVGTVSPEEALDFRCAIKAESLEVIDATPDRRIKEPSISVGFQNTLAKDVVVEMSQPGHNDNLYGPSMTFYVTAHGSTGAEMLPGEVAAIWTLAESADLPIEKRKKEQLVYKGKLPLDLRPDYVYSAADSNERRVSYRIVEGKIELTEPTKPK